MSSTPDEPEDPSRRPNPSPQPDSDSPTDTVPPLPPASATPVPQPGYGPVPGPYAPASYDPTFAPVPRRPRSPWIAPQRKAAVAAIALVAAVLLLSLGFLGGSLLAAGDHHGSPMVSRESHGQFYGPRGGANHQQLPRRAPAATPSPAPSSS